MGMFDRWRGRRKHPAPRTHEETVTSPAPQAAPSASGTAWQALPPVQRVLAPPTPIAEHGFAASLATHWDPSFHSHLGHGAVPDAPAGLLLDAVRPVPPSSTTAAELPGVRLPAVRPASAEAGAGAAGVSGVRGAGAARAGERPQAGGESPGSAARGSVQRAVTDRP
ncbi:hypothetical protein ABZV60_33050, partial [Streptomyces sp. NPDC004787]